MRFFLNTSTLFWSVGLLATLFCEPELGLDFFLLFAMVALALGALVIFLFAACCNSRHSQVAGRSAIVVGLGILFFLFGHDWASALRFSFSRARFEEQITGILRAQATGKPVTKAAFPDLAKIDPGPPQIVAFIWATGVTDNWAAIVHDPAGRVANFHQWEKDPSKRGEFEQLKMLFGGELYRVRHASGAWYFCSFT